MANVEPYFLGRHITACSLIGQTVTGATGALTPNAFIADLVVSTGALHSTLAATVGLLDDIEVRLGKNVAPISAVNRTRAHHVPISRAYEFTVVEILRRTTGSGRLANLWYNGGTGVVQFVYGRAGKLSSFYAVMAEYTPEYSRTKCVGRLLCRPCDANSAPTYTTADR
jgi:hypothetical protein